MQQKTLSLPKSTFLFLGAALLLFSQPHALFASVIVDPEAFGIVQKAPAEDEYIEGPRLDADGLKARVVALLSMSDSPYLSSESVIREFDRFVRVLPMQKIFFSMRGLEKAFLARGENSITAVVRDPRKISSPDNLQWELLKVFRGHEDTVNRMLSYSFELQLSASTRRALEANGFSDFENPFANMFETEETLKKSMNALVLEVAGEVFKRVLQKQLFSEIKESKKDKRIKGFNLLEEKGKADPIYEDEETQEMLSADELAPHMTLRVADDGSVLLRPYVKGKPLSEVLQGNELEKYNAKALWDEVLRLYELSMVELAMTGMTTDLTDPANILISGSTRAPVLTTIDHGLFRPTSQLIEEAKKSGFSIPPLRSSPETLGERFKYFNALSYIPNWPMAPTSILRNPKWGLTVSQQRELMATMVSRMGINHFDSRAVSLQEGFLIQSQHWIFPQQVEVSCSNILDLPNLLEKEGSSQRRSKNKKP